MGELSDEEFKPLLWLIPLLDGESVPGKPHEHLLEKIQNLHQGIDTDKALDVFLSA